MDHQQHEKSLSLTIQDSLRCLYVALLWHMENSLTSTIIPHWGNNSKHCRRLHCHSQTPRGSILCCFVSVLTFTHCRYDAFLKRIGLRVVISSSKRANVGEPKAVDASELSEIIGDEDKLRDTLLRVFIFYCSFGDHLNTDVMTQAKFSKFIKDIDVVGPGLREADADLVFNVCVCMVAFAPSPFSFCVCDLPQHSKSPDDWTCHGMMSRATADGQHSNPKVCTVFTFMHGLKLAHTENISDVFSAAGALVSASVAFSIWVLFNLLP